MYSKVPNNRPPPTPLIFFFNPTPPPPPPPLPPRLLIFGFSSLAPKKTKSNSVKRTLVFEIQ